MMEYLQMAPVACFIFAFTILTSIWAFYSDNIYAQLILHPFSVYRKQRVYTVVSSGFIHADIMHLLFNMLSFSFFAFTLEAGSPESPGHPAIPGIGHWQFGVLYFISLVLSDLPTVYKHRNDEWYHSLGASGAVSAVIFSYILYNPVSKLGLMIIPGVEMYAVVFGVLYLIYCNYAAKRAADNINHDAHMFGALSGLLITIALHPHVVNGFIIQINEKVQSWMH